MDKASKHDLLWTLGLVGTAALGLTGLYVWLGSGTKLLPPPPPPPPTPTPPAPVHAIGVVQPMPQTRLDMGSSFPMVTGRNYKIFERPVDPSRFLPPFLRPGMKVTAVFLDPVGGVRETSVTYTGPSDNVAFGPPQATGVFVGVQDDVVAV